MRLAISNIAWDASEDADIAALLRLHTIDAIDVAPGKYFPDVKLATKDEILKVRDRWSGEGMEITGMQALLFGTVGLNMFGAPEARTAMLMHLGHVCRIGAGLGATRLVFGSPKNRDRGERSDPETASIALEFFLSLGQIANEYGVIICLEPNPPCYGANFMTNSADTALVVTQVAHPAIRMQLDTGSLAINGEDVAHVLQKYASLIGHVHASEPDLVPLGDGSTDHAKMGQATHQYCPNHVVTVEMVATKTEPHAQAIARALNTANQHYRVPEGANTV